MADLKVTSVPCRQFPWPAPKPGYVGWERVYDGEYDVEIPSGHKWRRLTTVVEVPDTLYYRLALAHGDLALYVEPKADPAPVAVPSAPTEGEE